MKTTYSKLASYISLLMAAALHTQTIQAQLFISIDMDTSTAGIQTTRVASPGETFDAAIVFDLSGHSGGVSSYGVSVQFDNTELSLNGAATELLPAGFAFNISSGVSSQSNDIGGGLGQVSTFEAVTFSAGPTSGTFTAGTIHFTVLTPSSAGGTDVTPGLFNSGIDGLFDNSSAPIGLVTFNSGSVLAVPEPSAYALATAGLLLAGTLFRRLRR